MMSRAKKKGPGAVFVIKDKINGHWNQSSGVGLWLAELSDSKVIDVNIPKFSPLRRLVDLKFLVWMLKSGQRSACLWWLEKVLGKSKFLDILEEVYKPGLAGNDILFVSAGSDCVPFSLALARITGSRCCCIMTPSVLGTGPFDFAIVPEHDFPRPSSNILVTLGAPNMISKQTLEKEGNLLASSFPSEEGEKWGILIGGGDAKYSIPRAWVEKVLEPLLKNAERQGARVFMTTSRRTPTSTEKKIEEVAKGFSNVSMLVIGSQQQWNPVPGMLAICSRVFCTEDSVSMISEAATAGHQVQILRVVKRGGVRRILQGLTAKMVRCNILSPARLWGVPRFDLMIGSFCKRGFAAEYDPGRDPGTGNVPCSISGKSDLNEARRAAEWIIEAWGT